MTTNAKNDVLYAADNNLTAENSSHVKMGGGGNTAKPASLFGVFCDAVCSALSRRGDHSRSGFTLVELLVVIAIIGVLVALLLPAVQAAREAARRMQCTNKLKQLALAIQNYHDVANSLPSASYGIYGDNASSPRGNRMRFSAFVAILPYIEQNSLYDTITGMPPVEPWSVVLTQYPTSTTASTIPFVSKIDTFLCPSDMGGFTAAPNDLGRTNYRVCVGDWPTAILRADQNNVYSTTGKGVLPENRTRGLFGPMVWFGFGAATDGTSNTIAVSERAISMPTTLSRVRTGYAWNQPTAVSNTLDVTTAIVANPQACRILGGNGGVYVSTANATLGNVVLGGMRWADSIPFFTTFSTIMPPNAPACFSSSDTGLQVGRLMAGPTSFHSGGVNAGFLDGSVRFVSDTINTGPNFSVSPVTSGSSPYGVWGALGSKNGGESASY
ncbi:MAG: DUF1559 domain-containing protein [Thermoguttaceae bacterium]